MKFNIANIFEQGGNELLQLLNYCVYCRKFDPIFILLIKNYQLMPRSDKAITLFNEFVAANAPLALSIDPDADYLLVQTIEKIRNLERIQNTPIDTDQAPDDDNHDHTARHTPYLPAKFLFDNLIRKIEADTDQIEVIEKNFDPTKSAVENLPDGSLSGAQLQYVEGVWKPARYRLTSAGFRIVANIAG